MNAKKKLSKASKPSRKKAPFKKAAPKKAAAGKKTAPKKAAAGKKAAPKKSSRAPVKERPPRPAEAVKRLTKTAETHRAVSTTSSGRTRLLPQRYVNVQ